MINVTVVTPPRRGARAVVVVAVPCPRGLTDAVLMPYYGVLLFLACAAACANVGTGRVSTIVCGDCDAVPYGCSPGCPVERPPAQARGTDDAAAILLLVSSSARGVGEVVSKRVRLPSPWQAAIGMGGLGLLIMEWSFVSGALRFELDSMVELESIVRK
eukprot:COSAG02_NODE_914_length_15990_cov_9.617897_1_plen_159_part_00